MTRFRLLTPNVESKRKMLLPTLITGLSALMVAHLAWRDPRYLIPFFALLVLMALPAYLARRRMRKLLLSGDVKGILGTWAGSAHRIMFPETMAPIMAATAYAAYGWHDEARRSLECAAKGPAWDAALEQRLFVETLLDTFEGERDAAIVKAEELEKLPTPGAGLLVRMRIRRLRRGLLAFARAFAHRATVGDAKWLQSAAKTSPLVHWAMRYASAVIALDLGNSSEARQLLDGAPEWPRQSAFRTFDEELRAHLGAA
jgi:hypothetical protein